MADVKRIALNTIGAPKKEKKSKSAPKTVRFTLTLGESNEKTCPEFNYKELLAAEERRALRKEARDGLHQNGNASFMDIDEDDEEGVRALARKFEEKYGGGEQGSSKSGKRKKKKNEQYVDLGAGYDDNDSFIDNTDAYDEIVPEEMTTAQGGFYINCGALEYKQLEVPEALSDGDDTVQHRKKAKKAIISSDESSSEEDDEDVEDEEEDSRDEIPTEDQPKRSEPKTPVEIPEVPSKPPDKPTIPPLPKPSVIPPQTVQPTVQPPILPQKTSEVKKLKRPAEALSINAGPSKKKSTTVKDLLKEKRDYNDPTESISSAPVQAQPKVSASMNSIADSIESVINAAWLMDDSKVLITSPSSIKSTSELEVNPVKLEMAPKPTALVPVVTASPTLSARLPENLPDEVRAVAQSLRAIAKQAGGNQAKFFASNITKNLIRLDQKTQNLSCRKEVFAYIADKVVCSAEGLMRKARKFTVGRERAKAKEPLVKLKATIDQLTPAVLEIYSEDCQKLKDSRFANGGGKGDWSPLKVFPLNSEIRDLLKEAIGPVAKIGDEKALFAFLESQVLPLWPKEWMTLATLLEEITSFSRPKEQLPSFKTTRPSTPPPQRSTSVITLAESPRLPDCTTLTSSTPQRLPQPAHTPISLKQRILQDASGGAFEQTMPAKQVEDLSVLWQEKTERPSPPPVPRPSSSNSHSPSPARDKVLVVGDSSKSSIKDKSNKNSSNKSQNIKITSTKQKDNNRLGAKITTTSKKKKWASVEITEVPKEISVPPPPPPTQEELDAKILEDKNKLIEETAAATDFLSQIIHQSLSGFPNASNFATNITETRHHSPPKEEMSSKHYVETSSHREEESVSPKEVIIDSHRERKLSAGEGSSSSARTSVKTPEQKLQQEPPALDSEASVQLEMKRVMQELMELKEQMNAVPEPPKVSPILDRIKVRSDRESPVRSLSSPDRLVLPSSVSITSMDRPRSRVDKARNLSGSSSQFNSNHISNNSDLVITPTVSSSYNSNNALPLHQSHALTEKSGRNSGVSVIAVNSGASRSNQHNLVNNPLGFQEEFQRHLMQEPEVVYVSSSPPSAFRPSPSQSLPSLGHIPYSSLHGQQMNQQHQLPSLANQDFRNSLFNYSQMQGSLQQQVLNHRARHYPSDLQQQPK